MIKLIIDLLQADEWLNQSETIDIAKGKHELATDLKTAKNKIKRGYLTNKQK